MSECELWHEECESPRCPWFWGSHGCDLVEGHEGWCACLEKIRDKDGNITAVELCSLPEAQHGARFKRVTTPDYFRSEIPEERAAMEASSA